MCHSEELSHRLTDHSGKVVFSWQVGKGKGAQLLYDQSEVKVCFPSASTDSQEWKFLLFWVG
jgi:hypothetical protein